MQKVEEEDNEWKKKFYLTFLLMTNFVIRNFIGGVLKKY